MAIFNQHTHNEIRQRFTHHARFVGLVPCYWNEKTTELNTANWVPEFALTAAIALYSAFIFTVPLVDEYYDPAWAITLVRKIE